jgi:hypothetical protein
MKINLKKENIVAIIFVFLFLCWIIFFDDPRQKERFRSDANIFRTSKINGKLYSIGPGTGTSGFVIEGYKYRLQASLIWLDANGKEVMLYRIADIGDSIYKEPFADTLYLVKKNGKRYSFWVYK